MPLVDGDGLERGLYTAEDYWGLPDDRRAELINGVLYDMAPPSTQQQAIVAGMVTDLTLHVRGRGGPCRVYGAPVAVRLNCGSNDESWVEPDVIVVCDPAKISDRGCEGAPDLAVEVVSPQAAKKTISSRRLPMSGLACASTGLSTPPVSRWLCIVLRQTALTSRRTPLRMPCPWAFLTGNLP